MRVPLSRARSATALRVGVCVAVMGIASLAWAQQPPAGDKPGPANETLPPPRPVKEEPAAETSEGIPPEPISLPAALALAQTSNLDIAQARAIVEQFQAVLMRARVQLLPNLNLGDTYLRHDGQIQKTEGNIITVNRDSDFLGGGPSLSVQLTDAIFGPLAARQVEIATEAGIARVTNDTLLAVAEAYFAILRARRQLARIDMTLDFLTSDRQLPIRGNSKGLLPLIRDIVEVGGNAALRADLERVRTEVLRRNEEKTSAILDYQLASAQLARLLRLDPAMCFCPIEDFRSPLPLPGEEWLHRPLEELVTAALTNRPELAENRALVEAAVARIRAAKFRPLLPNLIVNYSYGDLGGGPDLNPPIVKTTTSASGVTTTTTTTQAGFGSSGHINHFKNSDDFGATIVWRLQNMGWGNRAEVREQKALYQQAVVRQLAAHDLVATQVVQAREAIEGWWQRLGLARQALFDDQGAATGPVFQSVRLNFERVRAGEGRPLELIDAIRGLNDLLEDYGQNMTDYERARFRLLIALGLPPQSLCLPTVPPPSTVPAADPPAAP